MARARADSSCRIKSANLRSRIGVTMPGWIGPVWDELSAATIFALPSRYEGFPSALLEAMALGVPSIAVDCESGPRAVISGNGICDDGEPSVALLTGNNTEALAAGIRRLVNEVDFREQLGRAGKSVVQRFSWETMVDAYEQVLCDASGAHA